MKTLFETIKKQILYLIFFKNDLKISAIIILSHMYNNAHGLNDSTKYFYSHSMSLFNRVRLLMAFFSFMHIETNKTLARIFRELVTDEEYHQLKLYINHLARRVTP